MLAIKPLIALLTVIATGAVAMPQGMSPDPDALGRRQAPAPPTPDASGAPSGGTTPQDTTGTSPGGGAGGTGGTGGTGSTGGTGGTGAGQFDPQTGLPMTGAAVNPAQSPAANPAQSSAANPATSSPIPPQPAAGGGNGAGDLTAMPQKPADLPAKGAKSSGKRFVAYWSVTHGTNPYPGGGGGGVAAAPAADPAAAGGGIAGTAAGAPSAAVDAAAYQASAEAIIASQVAQMNNPAGAGAAGGAAQAPAPGTPPVPVAGAPPVPSPAVVVKRQEAPGGKTVLPEPSQMKGVTHLILDFADAEKLESWQTSWATNWDESIAKDLREKYPGLKVTGAFGGWGQDYYYRKMCGTDAGRQELAKKMEAFRKRYALDGIDFDWEYPVGNGEQYKVPGQDNNPNEQYWFVDLVYKVRKEIGSDKILSAALPGKPGDMLAYNKETIPALSETLDFFNLMTYDIMNRRDAKGVHHSGGA